MHDVHAGKWNAPHNIMYVDHQFQNDTDMEALLETTRGLWRPKTLLLKDCTIGQQGIQSITQLFPGTVLKKATSSHQARKPKATYFLTDYHISNALFVCYIPLRAI